LKRFPLHWQILLAIVLAGIAGVATGPDLAVAGVRIYAIYDFLGTLFLNALMMLVVPLIAASIITGISGMDTGGSFARLGLKTIAFYLASSLAAILVGLVLVNAIQPGQAGGEPLADRLHWQADTSEFEAVLEQVDEQGATDLVNIFLRMVPTNVLGAAAEGDMLALIFFSLLFGFFMTRITPRYSQALKDFWQGVFETMMAMTHWVMRFTPLGVFGLVAKTLATTGFAAVVPMLMFFATVALALVIHMLVVLGLVLWGLARVRPLAHLRAMAPALLTAFSTASSAATLPLTMERVEQGSGVSARTTGFVLPLGATINMDGTALYECVAALFIAQAYGIDLSLTQQFVIVLTALLTSIGVAGIPAASLVAILIILGVVGLPLEGLGLLMVTDRLLDMMRTAVNVYSDTCGAVLIARSEGESTAIART